MAALIDGRVSETRAASLRSHLASCAECREVFFETVDFVLGEEAQGREAALLPFEGPRPAPTWKSRVKYALPAAALLAASLAFVIFNYQAAPQFALAKFASNLSKPRKEPEYHDIRKRGVDSPEQAPSGTDESFRLGDALVNLQVSLERENRDQADAALAKINGLNDDLGPQPKVKNFYRRLHANLPARLRPYAETAGRMAERFRAQGSPADPLYLDFGMWTEAGKLAASVADSDFLTSRDNRRFPTYLRRQLKKEGDSLPLQVQGALKRIESILERDRLGAKDYRDLAQHYETILKTYDER